MGAAQGAGVGGVNIRLFATYGERRAEIHTLYLISQEYVGREYRVVVDKVTRGTHRTVQAAKDEAERVVGVALTWEAK